MSGRAVSGPAPFGSAEAPLLHELLRELRVLDDDRPRAELAELLVRRPVERQAQRIGVAETAALLDVHPDTLVRWARTGRISAEKVGREWRFDPERLEVAPASGTPAAAPAIGRRSRPARAEFSAVDALRALG